jgi:hypothetical protein
MRSIVWSGIADLFEHAIPAIMRHHRPSRRRARKPSFVCTCLEVCSIAHPDAELCVVDLDA